MIGGKGNDTISFTTSNVANNVINYANGDGNDIITNYSDKTTLNITSGSISQASISGNDVILKIN